MNTNEITAKAVKAIEVAPQYQAIQAITAWAAGQFFCGGASIPVNRWEAITDGEHYRMAARAARKVVGDENNGSRNIAAFAGMGEIYEAAASRLDSLYAAWMLDLAAHQLSEILAVGMLEDACDEHGENCPAGEGGTCRHYHRIYSFDFESTAREAARWAFVAGRVYAYESASITFWPFADRVPQS